MHIVIINIILIIMLSISLSIFLDTKIYQTLSTSVLVIPIALMYFGFIIDLRYAVYIIYGIIVLLSFLALLKVKKAKFVLEKQVIIFYMLTVLYFVLINYNRHVWSWDEFSHWARVVKNMNFTHHLTSAADTYVKFKAYPPNASLFLFFFNYGKNFYENNLYIAQSIYTVTIVFSATWYLIYNKKMLEKIVILILLILAPTGIYHYAYNLLYVDCIMGILMGYAIIEYIYNDNIKLKFLNILLSLSALTLTKDAGTVLAIIALFMMIIDNIIKNHGNEKLFKSIRPYLIILFVVLVVFISYDFHLKIVGIKTDKVETYVNLFNGLPSYGITVAKNFWSKLKDYNLGNIVHLSALNFIILSFLVPLIFKIFVKNNNDKCIDGKVRIMVLLPMFFIVYIVLLLYTYICWFSESEAINLASFDRYLLTYILCTVFFDLVIIFDTFFDIRKILVTFLVYSLVFNVANGVAQVTFNAILLSNRTEVGFSGNQSVCNKIMERLTNSKKYTVVSVNNTSFVPMAYDYYIGPEFEQFVMSKPELKSLNNDSVIYKSSDWIKILQDNNVEIVYLYGIDNSFKDSFSDVFENKDDIASGNMFYIKNNLLVKC